MKIYTKTGDGGDTGLFGGLRVSKSDPRVDAYGDIDELNSVIGMVRAEGVEPDVDALLGDIQLELFDIGAELATQPGKEDKLKVPMVTDAQIERFEHAMDRAETELAPLTAFVLPGGSKTAAVLHLARTVCRRAERRIVALSLHERVRPEVIRYVNRLSDLLFTLARLANVRRGVPDVSWHGRERQTKA